LDRQRLVGIGLPGGVLVGHLGSGTFEHNVEALAADYPERPVGVDEIEGSSK
jgi:hypothetical protein